MADTQMIDTIELRQLATSSRGRIKVIEAEPEETYRLVGLGICEGRIVELVQAGDPLILRVYGRRIGLSARLARGVRVEPLRPDPEKDWTFQPASANATL